MKTLTTLLAALALACATCFASVPGKVVKAPIHATKHVAKKLRHPKSKKKTAHGPTFPPPPDCGLSAAAAPPAYPCGSARVPCR